MRYNRLSPYKYTRYLETNQLRPALDFSNFAGIKTRLEVPYNQGTPIDKLSVQMYGQGNETSWWEIAYQNRDRIIGWKGDFSKIRTLRIPNKDDFGSKL